MYSAWFSAFISGIVAAVVMAIGGAMQLVDSSTPDPLPVAFIVGTSAIAALLAGSLVAVAVRCGLFLARCRQLAVRFALAVAVVNVAVLGILATVPVETHAIKLDMPSGTSSPVSNSPVEVPLFFWLTTVVAFLVPVLVAYIFGRIARGGASAA
jgi:hypothetical protein